MGVRVFGKRVCEQRRHARITYDDSKDKARGEKKEDNLIISGFDFASPALFCSVRTAMANVAPPSSSHSPSQPPPPSASADQTQTQFAHGRRRVSRGSVERRPAPSLASHDAQSPSQNGDAPSCSATPPLATSLELESADGSHLPCVQECVSRCSGNNSLPGSTSLWGEKFDQRTVLTVLTTFLLTAFVTYLYSRRSGRSRGRTASSTPEKEESGAVKAKSNENETPDAGATPTTSSSSLARALAHAVDAVPLSTEQRAALSGALEGAMLPHEIAAFRNALPPPDENVLIEQNHETSQWHLPLSPLRGDNSPTTSFTLTNNNNDDDGDGDNGAETWELARTPPPNARTLARTPGSLDANVLCSPELAVTAFFKAKEFTQRERHHKAELMQQEAANATRRHTADAAHATAHATAKGSEAAARHADAFSAAEERRREEIRIAEVEAALADDLAVGVCVALVVLGAFAMRARGEDGGPVLACAAGAATRLAAVLPGAMHAPVARAVLSACRAAHVAASWASFALLASVCAGAVYRQSPRGEPSAARDAAVLGALGMLGGMLGGAGIASCGGAPGAWRATWMVFCAAHWFARTLRRSLAKDGALWALARLVLALVLPSLCASAPFASL